MKWPFSQIDKVGLTDGAKIGITVGALIMVPVVFIGGLIVAIVLPRHRQAGLVTSGTVAAIVAGSIVDQMAERHFRGEPLLPESWKGGV